MLNQYINLFSLLASLMGVCTSTTQNKVSTNSTCYISIHKQQDDNFDPPFCEEEVLRKESENSEIFLLDTDELNQNQQQAQQEETQRKLVHRIVSVHDSPNSKQFFIVYDSLYHIQRKVPKLKSIKHSSLFQKRRNQKL